MELENWKKDLIDSWIKDAERISLSSSDLKHLDIQLSGILDTIEYEPKSYFPRDEE